MPRWVQKSYLVPELHVVTNYMIEILFLVKNVKVLLMYFPQNSRTSDSSLRGMRILGKKLTAISVNVDKLTDEWNQYCLEDIKEEWYQSNDGKPLRVDYYWSKLN